MHYFPWQKVQKRKKKRSPEHLGVEGYASSEDDHTLPHRNVYGSPNKDGKCAQHQQHSTLKRHNDIPLASSEGEEGFLDDCWNTMSFMHGINYSGNDLSEKIIASILV